MVKLEPYNFQKKTNIGEHNDIVDKVNEIIDVVNGADLENIGTDITALEGKVTDLETTVESHDTAISENANDITDINMDIATINAKDTEQDTKISTAEGNISALETTVGSLDTELDSAVARVTTLENDMKDCAVASTLSTTKHIDTDKLGISINSVDGQTNKVAYIPVATADTVGLMSGADKAKLDSIDPSPAYELPIASSTVLGGIKVGANLAITDDGVLSATGGGGSGVSLPAHTVGANDDNPLVQVDPVIQSGNIILRTTYKDYASDGSTSQKQDDSTIFPTATSERPGVMSTTDKAKLDGMPDGSTIATKTEVQTVQTNLTEFESELISDPSALVGLATTAHAGLMSTGDKTKLDGMPSSGDIALKSELSALTGELMNTPADVVGMATGTAGGLMSATDKVKMDTIPSADTIATDADIADIQNQISGLKLSEVSPNGIMLNGDSVTAVRSVAGSVSGSDLTINVNGIASQPITLPTGNVNKVTVYDINELVNYPTGSIIVINGKFGVNYFLCYTGYLVKDSDSQARIFGSGSTWQGNNILYVNSYIIYKTGESQSLLVYDFSTNESINMKAQIYLNGENMGMVIIY